MTQVLAVDKIGFHQNKSLRAVPSTKSGSDGRTDIASEQLSGKEWL